MEDTITKRYIILLAAALLLLFSAAAAEETPPAEAHSSDHVTMEVAQQGMDAVPNGSEETHTLLLWYDLYCVNCGKIVQEKVRQVQLSEAHHWSTALQEPTCEADGKETKKCLLCGFELTAVLPAPGHQWSDWLEDAIDPQERCTTDVTARRVCASCGSEETKVISAAPGHQWTKEIYYPATCTEAACIKRACTVCEKEEVIQISDSPALGHLFADASVLAGCGAGEVTSSSYPGIIVGTVDTPSTCTENGSGSLLCVRCQEARQGVSIPSAGHSWGEWQKNLVPEDTPVCETEITSTRICHVCQAQETRVDTPAPGHKWLTLEYVMPTCTQEGRATLKCSVCGKETSVDSAPLGHSYVWVQVTAPSPGTDGLSEYTCAVCGDVADQRRVPYTQMVYNSTVTSFGPTTRDLIGGNVWNRVTPIDLSQDGVFTYPLVAGNRYTVGTATVVLENGVQTVTYRLNSSSILVHSESLILYPSVEALRTGENAESFIFGMPIDCTAYYGDDMLVIMAISLKADFNAVGFGVQEFVADQAQIDAMLGLLD